MVDLTEFCKPPAPLVSGSGPYLNSGVQKMNETAAPPALLVGGGGSKEPHLWHRKPPQYVRQQELDWHRHVIHLSARGFQANEIAAILGRATTTVQDILRQPFYKDEVVAEIRRVASEDEQVVRIVKENVAKAVGVLAQICEDTAAPKRDRIAAANAILDRRYGKPNQPIARDTGIDLDKLTDEDLAKMLPATFSTGTTP
jgi:uncharacterized protein (UPF0147 family)